MIKISSEKNNLYVLRYKRFGHYYVGTAENFEERMLVHWRRTVNLPQWSTLNESRQGFIFFWFNIEEDGILRSCADHCENKFAKLIAEKIKCINEKKFIKEVHVGNNNFIDGKPESNKEKYINKNDNIDNKIELNDIDKEIMNYFKNPEPLKTKKGEFQIKCCGFGVVEEFDCKQCNKIWKQVASIKYPIDYEKADFFDILFAEYNFQKE